MQYILTRSIFNIVLEVEFILNKSEKMYIYIVYKIYRKKNELTVS